MITLEEQKRLINELWGKEGNEEDAEILKAVEESLDQIISLNEACMKVFAKHVEATFGQSKYHVT